MNTQILICYILSIYLNVMVDVCITVDSPFCLPSTCPIRYLFSTLQQFPSGSFLLVQPVFSKPPWSLWLRVSSDPIVILSSLNLALGFFSFLIQPIRHHPSPIQVHLAHKAPSQAHLGTILGPLRHPRPIRHHLRPTKAPLAHYAPPQAPQAHQAPPQAHLGTLGPFGYTWLIRHHLRPTQAPQDH